MYLYIVFLLFFSFLTSFFLGTFIGFIFIYLNVFCLIISVMLTHLVLYEVLIGHFTCYLNVANWFYSFNLNFNFELIFDELSTLMLYVVLFVSLCVHIFSIFYIKFDPNYNKFFSYLTLFTFFMILLVLSSNFIQFFLGWEGIGLCSYLLINFWSTRLEANRSAIKAMVLNKIGDCSFYILIVIYYLIFNSFDFITSQLLITYFINFYIFDLSVYNILSFFVIIAAVAKSAQIGLHVWLPDAMEGPTPVSSLLHAATMVTAGIYLIFRTSWIIDLSSLTVLIVVFGVLTSFFTSLVASFQYDIKKIIAYSTASQISLMFVACGMSIYNLAFFHLFNHAFFKALLFLCAGSIIHYLNDVQDLRNIKNINLILPFTSITFLIAQLALIGFPFLSSFYSKDFILHFINLNLNTFGYFIFWCLNMTLFLTAFYSLRLIKFIFFNKSLFVYKFVYFNESDINLIIPLFILSVFSIFSGYFFLDIFMNKSYYYFKNIFIFSSFNKLIFLNFLESSDFFILFLGLFGCFLGFNYEFFINKYNFFLSFFLNKLLLLFNKKWFFDTLYYYFVTLFINFFFYLTYKIADKLFFENAFNNKLIACIKNFSLTTSFLQKTHIYYYIFIFFSFFFFIFVFFLINKFMLVFLFIVLNNLFVKKC